MPKLVTSGAMLQCTLGSTPSQLQVPAAGRVMAGNVPVTTITDTAAGIISPFGSCGAMSPPQGGVISIVAPGQRTTTVARAGSVLQSARPGYLW